MLTIILFILEETLNKDRDISEVYLGTFTLDYVGIIGTILLLNDYIN